jgi:Rel/ankyrin family protein
MKTFPKVQLLGYKGPAKVVVSCVTNEPERPKAHPHMLVSPPRVRGCRESLPAKDGICVASVTNPDMTVEFQHLGIQCKKKNEVEQSLEQRRKLRIDPYGQGFDHGCSKNKARSIDLNAVKLCFQAYLFNPDTGRLDKKLDPVCSNPIFNPRTVKELHIVDLSHDVAPAEGGKKIIILCEGVNKDDVRVRFFQDDNNWEGFGVFTPDKVHKQCAISLATPPYTLAVLARPKQVRLPV